MRTYALASRSIAAGLVLLAAGCGGSSDTPAGPIDPGNPNNPTAITGIIATPVSATSIRVTFTSRAGDNNYFIERAEGSTGAFAGVGSVPAPSSATALTFTDANLKASTLYRYRVIAVVGNVSAPASSEVTATTLAVPQASGSADITGDITTSRTFFAETTYTLKGFIHVTNGATLTIRPGTVIKGDYNTVGSALFIMRGAKINAVGTADAPIVFTSSRAAGSRQPGDWGGLVIIGNGVSNRSGSVLLDATGSDGSAVASGKNYNIFYTGGLTPNDDSGTLSYVRVEFAGHAPTVDSERGAFTFASVGSATRVSYLQTMGAADDAYTFFGGALDGDHLVAYETGDDMFDMTEGFSGRLQYLIGMNAVALVARGGVTASGVDMTGIESDGCFGSGCDLGFNTQPLTIPLLANFTLVSCGWSDCGGSGGGLGISLRRGSGGYFVNGVINRFPTVGISMRDLETFVRTGGVATPNLNTSDLLLRNLYFSESGGVVFQPNQGGPVQFALDLPSNNITNGTAIASGLFTTFPIPRTAPASTSDLDWTPQSASPIAAGGMAVFSGRLQQKASGFVTGTTYLGAADPAGAKWWTRWTTYVRN